MDTTIIAVLAGLVSAIITSLVSHWLLLNRIRREAMEPFRSEFYQKQLSAYQKLWSHLGPTSRFSSESTVLIVVHDKHYLNVKNANEFTIKLRGFFFSEDGIFLSRAMRKAIFDSLDLLEEKTNQPENPADDLVAISPTQATKIRRYFTGIHMAAREDIALADIAFPKSELGLDN